MYSWFFHTEFVAHIQDTNTTGQNCQLCWASGRAGENWGVDTDPSKMWTSSGNLMIYKGKTTEHNHLKPFTGQEILSFILSSLCNQASALRTMGCWTCMTVICNNLLKQGSIITWMGDYEIQVGMIWFLGWHRNKDS